MIKNFKPINTRHIYNGLLFFLIFSFQEYQINSIKDIVKYINTMELNIQTTGLFIVLFYLCGVLISFIAYLMFDIFAKKLFLLIPKYNNTKKLHTKVVKLIFDDSKLVNSKSLQSLDNYKKLENYLYAYHNNLYLKFEKDKNLVLTTRDLLMMGIVATCVYFSFLYIIMAIFISLVLFYIINQYEIIILKAYIEVTIKNKSNQNFIKT